MKRDDQSDLAHLIGLARGERPHARSKAKLLDSLRIERAPARAPRFALRAFVLLSAATVTGAAAMGSSFHQANPIAPPLAPTTLTSAAPSPPRVSVPTRAAPVASAEPPEVIDAPIAIEPAPRAATRAIPPHRPATVAANAAPPTDDLAAEIALLDAARSAFLARRDDEAARALDAYGQRFVSGSLTREAAILRSRIDARRTEKTDHAGSSRP